MYKGKEYKDGALLYTDNTFPTPCLKAKCKDGVIVSMPEACKGKKGITPYLKLIDVVNNG